MAEPYLDERGRTKRSITTGMLDEPVPSVPVSALGNPPSAVQGNPLQKGCKIFPGMLQQVMLNWPLGYSSNEVFQVCEQQKDSKDQVVLTSQCLTCGAVGHTRAVSNFVEDPTVPDWTHANGWYAICQC